MFYSVDQALAKLPEVKLADVDYQKAKNGVKVTAEFFNLCNGEFVRLKDPEGNLFAIGRTESNFIGIERILNLK